MDYRDYNIFPVEFIVDVNITTPKIKLCDFLNWDALYGFPPPEENGIFEKLKKCYVRLRSPISC